MLLSKMLKLFGGQYFGRFLVVGQYQKFVGVFSAELLLSICNLRKDVGGIFSAKN